MKDRKRSIDSLLLCVHQPVVVVAIATALIESVVGARRVLHVNLRIGNAVV